MLKIKIAESDSRHMHEPKILSHVQAPFPKIKLMMKRKHCLIIKELYESPQGLMVGSGLYVALSDG